MNRKEHLTLEGIQKILAIKASINWGLSDALTKIFLKVIPISRPLVLDQTIKDPSARFARATDQAAGGGPILTDYLDLYVKAFFFVNIKKSNLIKIGEQVLLIFKIGQHTCETQLMKQIIIYLECDNYYPYKGYDFDFCVNKFSNIVDIIIPIFDKYKIIGVKYQYFQYFKKVAELMKTGKHLTIGLEKIRKIKAGMNTKKINQIGYLLIK